MPVAERAAMHRALGDEHRLRIVDWLLTSDRTPGELGELTGLSSNLLAFHLRILEEAGVLERHRSEGDSRRRYVHLRSHVLEATGAGFGSEPSGPLVFVCTHNSARSQFAEALWQSRGGGEVWSAGTHPSPRVHPQAIAAGRDFGVDLAEQSPKGYEDVPEAAGLVVSVCDRAFEAGVPIGGERIHWSVPDPVWGGQGAFEVAFVDIAERVGRLWDTVGSRHVGSSPNSSAPRFC
jgi:protein-tyrosine-phosphatase/DNA-binding transcriptional ArsR family regulator